MDIQRLREKIDELESYLHELEMLLPENEHGYGPAHQKGV